SRCAPSRRCNARSRIASRRWKRARPRRRCRSTDSALAAAKPPATSGRKIDAAQAAALPYCAARRARSSPAARLARSRRRVGLLLPSLEGFGEGALAGRAFFQRENGAAIVVVNDGDVEPSPLLEQLQIAIAIRVLI